MAEGEGDSSTGFRGRTIAHEAPRIGDVYGASTPFAPGESWPTRVDELLLDGVDREGVEWFQSACVLCSNGCGLDIAVSEGRIVGVRGRGDDRVNQGRLGPKGLYGWQANNAPDRLTHPLVRRNGGARISGVREGVVFAPWHYGYWDGANGHERAANELTMTQWDPVSKQPIYKVAAVRVEKVADSEGVPAPAPTATASKPVAEGASRR